ncbi:PDC sensor domain-containing protein [Pseudothermotoga thermarum]|uniref:PDC sensor domain-containing protein n=1 Tax=Pseudothermotoga thermarum TaxID=119394 RepID=UPI0002E9D0FD|nr:methyl-accepting chemotaxis protein [Pseudothermotoga thermarum]
MGIRFKVISLVLLLVVLTAAVLTVVNLLEIRNLSLNSAVNSLKQKAEKESLIVDNWIKSRLATLSTISADFQTFLMLFEKSFVTMTLKAKIDQLEPLGFVDWFFANFEGKAYTLKDKEIDLSQMGFFNAIINEGRSYFVATGINWEGVKSIVFAVPVYSYEGVAEGVFGAVMPQKLLQDFVSSVKYGQTGYAYISDFTGKIVAHPKEEYVSKKLSELDPALKPIEEQIAKKSVSYVSYVFEKIKRLVAMAPVESAEWMLCAGIFESELNAPFIASLKKSVLTTAVAVLVSIVIGFLFGRVITKPILDLTEFSKQIASGDLTGKFEVKSRDETGQLSKVLILLVENLRNSIAKIVNLKEEVST